jgi:UDP-N-acetylglucosamine 2-epimerase (non-hydrolysing)
MAYMDKLLKETAPILVLVEGDTNSVLAAALAANKRGIPIGHVEAGLRSFDLRMPEEHNRRLTDHISEYLFAPTVRAEANLKSENVWGKIYVTGNAVIDAVNQHLPIAEKTSE